MNSGKRAVVAGPGNPPVVVDETADLDRAARSIIQGGAYDNNLLCIAEKEVFVVAEVFDEMLAAMDRAGAARLNTREIDALTKIAITSVGEGDHKHDVAAKEFIGQDAAVLAAAIGKKVSAATELLFGATDESNPFVPVEQMMPFIPFVKCRDVDEAIAKAKHYEHGFRHTSILHQCSQHDQDGPGDGHHAVRQERPLHGIAGPRRRRIPVVLDRHADGRGCDHAADVHSRTSLLDGR
jgi:aldehyde dehydrogenase